MGPLIQKKERNSSKKKRLFFFFLAFFEICNVVTFLLIKTLQKLPVTKLLVNKICSLLLVAGTRVSSTQCVSNYGS